MDCSTGARYRGEQHRGGLTSLDRRLRSRHHGVNLQARLTPGPSLRSGQAPARGEPKGETLTTLRWLNLALLPAVGVSCHAPAPGAPTPHVTPTLAIRINQLGYLPDARKVAVACAL